MSSSCGQHKSPQNGLLGESLAEPPLTLMWAEQEALRRALGTLFSRSHFRLSVARPCLKRERQKNNSLEFHRTELIIIGS